MAVIGDCLPLVTSRFHEYLTRLLSANDQIAQVYTAINVNGISAREVLEDDVFNSCAKINLAGANGCAAINK
ncbi:hypothetical protein RBSWK_04019 [Rhodopirellula baltica SWK14]|uniref:Uncharacterized protein n=1 Tax=Rhodopirellula baltica SWK14 TaxID=993516 RepID=L7CG67_RHOBT|nr:hypothetical protein RBSWK_04019 [Rhodopirellula baltica SWK14]